MKNLNKMAVIGDKDSVLVFKALGADIFSCTNAAETKEIIKTLTAENYSLILITEKEALKIEDYLNKLNQQPYPIILPIPDGTNLGYGIKKLYDNAEKALGTTSVFGKEAKEE